MRVKDLLKKIADAVFPYIPRCAVCGVEKGVANYLCADCKAEMDKLNAGQSRIGDICAFSLYKYDGAAKALVRGLKYNGKKWLAPFLGQAMYEAALGKDGWLSGAEIGFVCNVPLHEKRRKSRGYDQAGELAKSIAELAGLPYVPALRRVRNTKTQTKLSVSERAENIRGAFEAAAMVSGSALLVDDVLTTGATAGECARVLKAAGSKDVYVLTYARAVMRDRV